MGLLNLLSANRSENLFLPAHGRGNALPKNIKTLLRLRPGIWDLPELFEIGGPLISEGAIAESQKSSAYEVGVDRCWYGERSNRFTPKFIACSSSAWSSCSHAKKYT